MKAQVLLLKKNYFNLKEKVFPRIQIKDQEVVDYYSENRNKYKLPKRVVIRQVVLASEREAKRVFYKVRAGSFASYAKKYSISPDAKDGGLVGPYAKGEMPRVFDVAFSMRTGEIRGILKSTYGFHVILLVKKIRKESKKLASVASEIRKLLLKKKEEEEYQKWLELALNAIEVKTPKPLW